MSALRALPLLYIYLRAARNLNPWRERCYGRSFPSSSAVMDVAEVCSWTAEVCS